MQRVLGAYTKWYVLDICWVDIETIQDIEFPLIDIKSFDRNLKIIGHAYERHLLSSTSNSSNCKYDDNSW